MNAKHFRIEPARWPEDRHDLLQVREAVFVAEQGVPLELERDAHDGTALHLLARDGDGNPVGTGRLLPDGHIGRIAVMRAWRGRGVGSALLNALVGEARKRGLAGVQLNAQCTAVDFYERHGFVAEGPVFDDAGIPHRHMQRELAP
jgi:predicted GNAT family N-acyltransferase